MKDRCLKCDKKFKARHKFNRLCPKCTKANDELGRAACRHVNSTVSEPIDA